MLKFHSACTPSSNTLLCSSKLYLLLLLAHLWAEESSAGFVYVWNISKASSVFTSHFKEQNRAVGLTPQCVLSSWHPTLLFPSCYQCKTTNWRYLHSTMYVCVLSSFPLHYRFPLEHPALILSPIANILRIRGFEWMLCMFRCLSEAEVRSSGLLE